MKKNSIKSWLYRSNTAKDSERIQYLGVREEKIQRNKEEERESGETVHPVVNVINGCKVNVQKVDTAPKTVPSCRSPQKEQMSGKEDTKEGAEYDSTSAEEVGEATRNIVGEIRPADLTGAPSTSGIQKKK